MEKIQKCPVCGSCEYMVLRSSGFRLCLCGVATFEAICKASVLLSFSSSD